MINNETNNSNQQKPNNNNGNPILNSLSNNNDIKNNAHNKDEEIDDSDNLKFKGFLPNNTDPFILQRFDSTNSPIAAQYKFSIDMPNVSQQRLHEYLNNDLLNALDVSPSISKINSGIPENMQNLNDLGDNNPNNLYGFSLYPQTNNNKNVEIENYIQNQNMNNANNYNYQNNFNYNYPNNNTNNNAYYQNFNNNYTNLNYNINDPKVFIPTKLRNAEQNNKQNNNKKETLNNGKNKFDNGKKNKQKNKKFFEVREGDWRCSNCNNLNFSFRNKCNRCSLPKELSQPMDPMNPQAFNQNQQFQLINGMNPNFMQGNVNNGSNVNYHA
jgi:hypothetical protein